MLALLDPTRVSRKLAALMAALAMVLWAPNAARAQAPPLFELGVLGIGGYTPDFPAADQNHFNGLPLPLVVYRGETLRAGEGSLVEGRIVRRDRFELGLSLDGSFSTDSDESDARSGMPDLDHLFELGPRLQITLARAARAAKIDFEIPVRAVLSTDFTDVRYRGVVLNPVLAYQHTSILDSGVRLKLSLGAIFADRRLMDYFYEVEPAFVNAIRPAFSAKAGYLGSELSLALASQLTTRIKLFGRASVGYFGGAANDDSPLHRDDTNYSMIIGVSWSLYQSTARGSH